MLGLLNSQHTYTSIKVNNFLLWGLSQKTILLSIQFLMNRVNSYGLTCMESGLLPSIKEDLLSMSRLLPSTLEYRCL